MFSVLALDVYHESNNDPKYGTIIFGVSNHTNTTPTYWGLFSWADRTDMTTSSYGYYEGSLY